MLHSGGAAIVAASPVPRVQGVLLISIKQEYSQEPAAKYRLPGVQFTWILQIIISYLQIPKANGQEVYVPWNLCQMMLHTLINYIYL